MHFKADIDPAGNAPGVENFDSLVPDRQVRQELGGISAMTAWRWDHEPERAPPGWEPPVKIGKRNYRRRSAIEAVKRGGANGEVRR
jgi:hypothetical protein